MKFTASGGRVDVSVTCEDAGIVLTVSDTGIGIHPDFLPHVFERFRQGDADSTSRARAWPGDREESRGAPWRNRRRRERRHRSRLAIHGHASPPCLTPRPDPLFLRVHSFPEFRKAGLRIRGFLTVGTLIVMMRSKGMNATEKHARTLLDRIPALQRRSDVDLLMFFVKHPRTLMSSEQLARLLGYELNGIAQSLDVLLDSGLLTRTQNPTRPARLYVFAPDQGSGAWLRDFVEFASTRDGRLALQRALPRPAGGTAGLPLKPGNGLTAPGGARPFLVRRQPNTPTEPLPEQPEERETVMAERDLVRTGIRGLDVILSDGIPRGNIILLEGSIGTGKTTLGVEFVYRGASQFDEPGIIVLFEVSPDRLVRDAAQLGWDLPALERARKLKIIFTTRQVFAQELQQADSLLLEEAAAMGARRIFVDGVPGASGAPWSGAGVEARDTFHVLTEGLQRENLTAVLAVEATAFSRSTAAGTARRIDRRHGHPAADGRGDPRHGAVDRDRQVARPRFSDGPAFVQDRRRPRHRGVPARAGAAAEPRRGRGVRSDDAHHHRCARPRRAGQWRLLAREHDGRRRHLGRRQERHGPAVSGRGGAPRASAA